MTATTDRRVIFSIRNLFNNNTLPEDFSYNIDNISDTIPISYQKDDALDNQSLGDMETSLSSSKLKKSDEEKWYQNSYKEEKNRFITEISNVIFPDEFIDGEISASEAYIEKVYDNGQIEYAKEALMTLYLENYSNVHLLEGILVMLSHIPYEVAQPQGQIMALGLLSHMNLAVRDKAIECFERWNSKKGLDVLKSIHCSPEWLQNYVNKVISYIERDGSE